MRWLLVVQLFGAAGCYRVARSMSRELLVRQGPVPRCDAIVVPGCPARADGGPSTCIARRVGAAVAAWRAGLAPRLVLSGGAVKNAVVEGRAMADHARALGVPDGALLVEPRARHTTENLRFASYLLHPHGWRRVLVISDAPQLWFAVAMADHAGLEAFGRLAHPDLAPRDVATLRMDALEPVRWLWR